MSVVLAVKDGDRIVMGTDCQVSYGGSKAIMSSPNLMKVWSVDGHPNTLMGGVGSLRDLNIAYAIDHVYDPMRDKAKENLDFKFVVNEVVPTLLNHYTEMGRTIMNNGIVTFNHSAFILAQGGNCYQIDTDGCVLDLVGDGEVMAVGSGSIVAESAYRALESVDMPIEEKVIQALCRAAEQDLHVAFPVYVKSTDAPANMLFFDGCESTQFTVDKDGKLTVEGSVDCPYLDNCDSEECQCSKSENVQEESVEIVFGEDVEDVDNDK